MLGLIRMRLGDAFEPGDQLIHTGVVFHRATAQWIHAEIDSVVPGGEASEVADDLNLAQLGKIAAVFADRAAQCSSGVDLGHVERGELVAAFAGGRFFEGKRFVLRDVCGDLASVADKSLLVFVDYWCTCHQFPQSLLRIRVIRRERLQPEPRRALPQQRQFGLSSSIPWRTTGLRCPVRGTTSPMAGRR